jgi:uncharacterized protein (TIGR01777 family)
MRIVITGGTGLLGRGLAEALVASGDAVVLLSRSGVPGPGPGQVWTGAGGARTLRWSGTDDTRGWAHVMEGCDAVVHLAGESIASGRWTPARKARLRDSRVLTTRGVVAAIAAAATPPRALLSGSAVGYYGLRGDTRLVEASAPGDDFLATLCVEWEREAARAEAAGTRVCLLRTGVVLSRRGGALEKMLLPFRLFAGGPVGDGSQYLSWVHLEDWVALARWLLAGSADGPFNLTAPEPVTNAEFSRAAASALSRPSWLPVPGFALRALMGEMADALLLGGQRVVPQRALADGFAFAFPTIDLALADLVG